MRKSRSLTIHRKLELLIKEMIEDPQRLLIDV